MAKKRNPGAVAKAWSIFNRNPKRARHDHLSAAKAAGINPHTAATQYQRWLHASSTQRKAKVHGNNRKKVDRSAASAVVAQS